MAIVSSSGAAASLTMHGFVGVVTLDLPAQRNALCEALVEGVLGALEASRKLGARAIVLTSAGPVFCAGADIKEALNSGWLLPNAATSSRKTPLDLFKAIEEDDRPIIAAVNGAAFGGGVEMVLSCDLAIAAESAKFALPEISLGVIPNTAMGRLPAIVGLRKAKELILTRRRFDAAEAKELGLINEVVSGDLLLARALVISETICGASPPGAIAAVKHGMKGNPDGAAMRAMLSGMREPEWREGFTAFFEKRPANYDDFWAEDLKP